MMLGIAMSLLYKVPVSSALIQKSRPKAFLLDLPNTPYLFWFPRKLIRFGRQTIGLGIPENMEIQLYSGTADEMRKETTVSGRELTEVIREEKPIDQIMNEN